MTAKITTLIDKYDNMEIIRDEIAAIIAVEIANQKVLAVADNQDPALYDFSIYTEKTTAWEMIENSDGKIETQVPLVNVYIESASIVNSKGSDVTQTVYNVKYNIDCLSAKNHSVSQSGIMRADELAARDAQRVIRLVRNILQSAVYRRLNYGGIISNRSLSSITMFQPQINNTSAQHVVGSRLVYTADITEYSPEYEAEIIDLIQGYCTRGDDGKILFEIEFEDLES